LIEANSDVVHLGDVGLGFGKVYCDRVDGSLKKSTDTEIRCLLTAHLQGIEDVAARRNINVYLIRGNHDATWVWYDDEFQAFVKEKYPHCIFVRDGDVAEFPGGGTALLLGGGISLDRIDRIPGVSYWSDEHTIELDSVPRTDVIFSHDCPSAYNNQTETLGTGPGQHFGYYTSRDTSLIHDCHQQRHRIDRIVGKCGARHLYHGHYHNSITGIQGRLTCTCLNIGELKRFNILSIRPEPNEYA
jgi:hypothetical protein